MFGVISKHAIYEYTSTVYVGGELIRELVFNYSRNCSRFNGSHSDGTDLFYVFLHTIIWFKIRILDYSTLV